MRSGSEVVTEVMEAVTRSRQHSGRPVLLEAAGNFKFRMLSAYCVNSAGLPVSRSILLAIGGCVENKLPKFIPSKG